MAIAPPQTRVDWLIENNKTFGESDYSADIRFQISQLRFEDGSAVTSEDCIDASLVPSDAELYIGIDPKFYVANS